MKKIIFVSISVLFALSASAQSGKVISAYNYLMAYNNKEGANNLEEAAKNIDAAAMDETTSKATKTWWYRSQIYQNISSEPSLSTKYPKASLEAVLSYQNMQKLNDPKFKDWTDAVQNMKAITSNLFNDGVTVYKAKNFPLAYQFFSAIGDVSDIVTARGEKVPDNITNMALRNAGLSAENSNDAPNAIAAYKKQLVIAPDSIKPSVYQSLISLNKKLKNMDEARRLTDEALAKYPDDKDILVSKINFFINDGKQTEAIEYLKKMSEKEPKSEEIQAALGTSYLNNNDTLNARKTFENLLTLNPESFEGNFQMGAMLFNRTKPMQEQMNALTMSPADQKKYDVIKAERNALFSTARTYLLKAQSKQPADEKIKTALNTIEAMTK